MTNTTDKGKKGEQIAKDFLVRRGYRILTCNYRFKKAEIDIIAGLDNWLVFIEVKWRRNSHFGHPEEAVAPQQIERIQLAAEHFLLDYGETAKIRFDIISITGSENNPEIYHILDAF